MLTVAVLAVINFFVSLLMAVAAGGQPSYNAARHRYELNDHNSVTIVSQAVYQHVAAAGERAFLGAAAVFLLYSAADYAESVAAAASATDRPAEYRKQFDWL